MRYCKMILALVLCLAMALSMACAAKTESVAPVEKAPQLEVKPTEEAPAVEPEQQQEVPAPFAGADIDIAVLAGPTGIGAVGLMEANELGNTVNRYHFSVTAANDEVVAGLSSGAFDIAAVATNVAANLYKKTSGAVTMVALNTRGVLYILENGESISSVKDLAGKTIHATGQGANPEYVLEYILASNGLTYSTDGSPADVQLEFMESAALSTAMAQGEFEVCMLPVPAVTGVQMQNQDVRIALDLTEEWNAISGTELFMGCVVARTAFLQENPEAVEQFLEEYEASVSGVLADQDHAAELCAKYGVVAKAPVAKKAIPSCSLCCITTELRAALEPYYTVLFEANPAAIGGAMPDDAFYYTAR